MNYFIKINESVFEISKTFAGLLEKDLIAVSKEIQDKRQTFVLDDSMLSYFQVVNSTSQTHFYISISNKKCRINKKFYTFLNQYQRLQKRVVVIGKQRDKALDANLFLDKFYTKPSVAEQCVSAFYENVKIGEKDLILEPSAGNGSFIKSLEEISCSKMYIDISPQDKKIVKADFLS